MPRKKIDLTGQTFGKLTVMEAAPSVNSHTYYHCLCSCGNLTLKTVAKNNLVNGKVTHCGCERPDRIPIELLDEISFGKYGLLCPWKYVPAAKRNPILEPRDAYWFCSCEGCATFVEATTYELQAGTRYTCGKPSCQAKMQERWDGGLFHNDHYQAVLLTSTRYSFNAMRARVADDRFHDYHGVNLEPSWLGSDGFKQFLVDKGIKPSLHHSIDRIGWTEEIDGLPVRRLGNYTNANTKWATEEEQARNKRNSVGFRLDWNPVTTA
jgi:hypothetical protein